MRKTFIASVTGLCLTSFLAVTNAQPQQPAGHANADALFMYSSGIDGLFVDPKDKGLLDALKMINARVGELPRELDEPNMPAPAIQLALDMLTGPMAMRAGMVPEDQAQFGPPFYAQFNFMPGDAAKVESLAGRFTAMLRNLGAPPSEPAPNMPGMSMIDADGMPVFFGAMKAGDQPAFVLGLNGASSAAVKPDATGLPAGVKPAFAFNFSAKELQPVMDMIMAQAGPDAAAAKMQLQLMGLYGPDASNINVVCGHGADRSHLAMRYTNYRQVLEQSKMLSSKRVTAEVLKRVPVDAAWAKVSAFKLSGIGDMLNGMAQGATQMEDPDAEPVDFMAIVEQQTGIHPQRDFFAHLGDYAGIYASDTTGGGGFMSAVAFTQVTNTDALSQTMTRVASMLNDISKQQARGYVRIAQKTVNEIPMTVLTFPGLPIPLEPCWAIVDGWMYGAGSPQALLAGINQARAGKSSLVDNPRFKEMGGNSLDESIQVSFMDTPKLLAGGYGIVSMGMAALANAVRSPSSDREPGLIMPSFAKLTEGAKACVYVSRLSGDDLMMTGQSDPGNSRGRRRRLSRSPHAGTKSWSRPDGHSSD
jgi:hypothetical protein